MQHYSLALLALLVTAIHAFNIGARAPAPAVCSTLNSCYARFTQSTPANAYCSSFLGTTVKSTTTTQTLTASTTVVTKIVTVRGTTTIPQTSVVDATASYVTSYQSCTLATASSSSSISSSAGSIIAAKRQVTSLDAPGCLQYMVAPGAAATTTACSCIASRSTSVVPFTKTITPKVSRYTWTGTVSLQSTTRPVTVVTNSPTYTVVMDPLPCVLSDATASVTTASSLSILTTTASSSALTVSSASSSASITTISSPTPTATPGTPPALCNNQGLQWELYSNIPQSWSTDYWQNFNGFLDWAKTNTPDLSGITSTLGGLTLSLAPTMTIYNNTTPFNTPFFTIEHHGYIYAPQTGQYTFNLGIADDFLAAWIGPNAVSGWTFSNPNALSNLRLPPASFTYTMTAGQYYPLRFVYANAYSGGYYFMYIVNPDGTNLTTSAEQGNPALVQFSCDGTTAPALGDWSSSGSA